MVTTDFLLLLFYILSGTNSKNGYLSINIGNQNVTEEKNELTVFEGFVIRCISNSIGRL